jgi:hypothetical protein
VETHCPDKAKWASIISKKNVGLLVNERLINMPPTIVPDLHAQLPDDLEFTKKQDDIENPAEFKYDYLLVLTKFTIPNEIVDTIKKGKQAAVEHRLYYRWEDQVFEPQATLSFNFQSTFKHVNKEGQKSWVQGSNA